MYSTVRRSVSSSDWLLRRHSIYVSTLSLSPSSGHSIPHCSEKARTLCLVDQLEDAAEFHFEKDLDQVRQTMWRGTCSLFLSLSHTLSCLSSSPGSYSFQHPYEPLSLRSSTISLSSALDGGWEVVLCEVKPLFQKEYRGDSNGASRCPLHRV